MSQESKFSTEQESSMIPCQSAAQEQEYEQEQSEWDDAQPSGSASGFASGSTNGDANGDVDGGGSGQEKKRPVKDQGKGPAKKKAKSENQEVIEVIDDSDDDDDITVCAICFESTRESFVDLECCTGTIHGSCLLKCIPTNDFPSCMVRCPFCRGFLCLVPDFVPRHCVDNIKDGLFTPIKKSHYEQFWDITYGNTIKRMKKIMYQLRKKRNQVSKSRQNTIFVIT